MYHYVRPEVASFPFFRSLHIDDFVKQLEYFENEYGYISKNDFMKSLISGKPVNGVILTFDDGFKDHYRYVLPELLKRDIWGIFYIPMSPFITGELIDVHRIHALLGMYGGDVISRAIKGVVSDKILSSAHAEEFYSKTYSMQSDAASTLYVKRLLNYFIDYKYRKEVIDGLMSEFFPNENELKTEFYMNGEELATMHAKGMMLGSHTVNHLVMSKLSTQEQENEIASSFEMLESITGSDAPKTFCYPYGSFLSFTSQTEELLEKYSCMFAFNVESRDICEIDLVTRRQALPRYDCNEFPNGSCRTTPRHEFLDGNN